MTRLVTTTVLCVALALAVLAVAWTHRAPTHGTRPAAAAPAVTDAVGATGQPGRPGTTGGLR